MHALGTLGLAAILAAAGSMGGPGPAGADPLAPAPALREAGGVGARQLSIDGSASLRETTSEIRDLRQVALPDSSGFALTWCEADPSGQLTPWYAISLDGATTAVARPASYEIAMAQARFDPVAAPPDFTASPLSWDGEVFLVQFVTQVLGEYRAVLEGMGARVYDHLVHHTLIVRMTPEVRARVATLELVRWVGAFHPELRLEPGLSSALAGGSLPHDQVYNLAVFERGAHQKQLVAGRILAMGGSTRAIVPDGFRLEARLSPAQLVTVLGMPEVAAVDRWAPGGADMDLVRVFSGGDSLEAQTGFSGQGVRGEVFDIGIDASHPDFQHDGGVLFHGPGGTSPHGTSTAGIVFGDGTSNAQARGLLPDGKIVFGYSPPFLNSGSSNRYQHTAELIEPGLPYQCVFQTSSTGSSRTLFYTSISAEMDDILFWNDIVVVQSHGNSGIPEARPESWAKNVVSSGGVTHNDTLTTGDDSWGGASSGPATDGRIKPDLAHFYDNIFTTGSGGHTVFGGTSAATAINAGHFGLFFQMWHNDVWNNNATGTTVFESRPHARLARAAMINTARQWRFSGANHNLTRVHQGWGAADVDRLYGTRGETFFVDETDPLDNLTTNTYALQVPSGAPELKATLVYRDPKGVPFSSVHRINDLTLRVTSPGGTLYWGNHGLREGMWSTPGGSANSVDVVENVFVRAPRAGTWTVEVIGADINTDVLPGVPGNNADYALWVTGVSSVPCSAPLSYCTAKATSTGSLPAIGSTGTPSTATQDFHLTLSGAMPGSPAISLWGRGAASVPFAGGFLCLAPPVQRGSVTTTGPQGTADLPLTILPAMVGQTVFYQWWFRDGGFAPPNGIGLSDALEVTFCNS